MAASTRPLDVIFTCEICRQRKSQRELVEIATRPGRAMRTCTTCEPAARRYVAARFPAAPAAHFPAARAAA
jgi:hypothetical protein